MTDNQTHFTAYGDHANPDVREAQLEPEDDGYTKYPAPPEDDGYTKYPAPPEDDGYTKRPVLAEDDLPRRPALPEEPVRKVAAAAPKAVYGQRRRWWLPLLLIVLVMAAASAALWQGGLLEKETQENPGAAARGDTPASLMGTVEALVAITPVPDTTVPACPHSSTTEEVVNTQYRQDSSSRHSYTETLCRRCVHCGNVTERYSRTGSETHTYIAGGTICLRCGYAKPTATATPKPVFNTAIYRGTSKKLSSTLTVPVYSGPGTGYYRGASGKAECSLHKEFFLWGYEDGWYMISYATNAGASRVGYVEDARIRESLSASTLRFAYKAARTTRSVRLTDDPDGKQGSITTLSAGAAVTYLATYGDWYYIECRTGGQYMRGFIPAGTLKAD